MNNIIEYKGFIGSAEFSEEDGVFFGKILGIRSLVSYEGKDKQSLYQDFRDAVDDYLSVCELKEKKAESPLLSELSKAGKPRLTTSTPPIPR